jgi:thioredoxin 1
MANIEDVTDGTFEEWVIQSELPVVVDFGAEWCHPCKQLDPIVDELAGEWDGKVRFYKIDSDVNVDTTMRLGVMGLPTLILFVGGEPKERLTGLQSKKKIVSTFQPHIEQD